MNYMKEVQRTNNIDYLRIEDELSNLDMQDIDILHAAFGMATESGEFIDQLKKSLFYGKELDTVNLKEELGDLLWYVAVACKALNTTIEQEMVRNIHKLKVRYPEKFTEDKAVNRDLNREREVLEFEEQLKESENE